MFSFYGTKVNRTIVMHVQAPNNVVTYLANGDSTATQFFQIDLRSGNVSVLRSLLSDPSHNTNYEVRRATVNTKTSQSRAVSGLCGRAPALSLS